MNLKTEEKCEDAHCPHHSGFAVRNRAITLTVTSAKMRRTATGTMERRHLIPKYERYEKRRTTLKLHNPDCINAQEGDVVIVKECRPISKTKKFVIVEKLKDASK